MQALLGAATVAATVLLLMRRTRWARAGAGPDAGAAAVATGGLRVTPAARRALLILACVSAAVLAAPALFPPLRATLFAFCGFCQTYVPGAATAAEPGGPAAAELALWPRLLVFLQAAWQYAATVLPVFALASFASGFLLAHPRSRLPRGPIASFALACVLPLCACGVVPVARAMFLRGRGGVRDGLVFLGAAPLMSPVVALLGVQLLGGPYLLARLGGAALIAAAASLFVPRFAGPHAFGNHAGEDGAGDASASAARAAGSGDPDPRSQNGGSSLESGWALLVSLLPFVLLGAVLGAAVAAVLPPSAVAAFAGAGGISIAAATVAGLPITMCAGEEIIILAPLAGLGIGLGHAVAFSLASTGICAGSLPLLAAVLGRRGALTMVVIYLVLPFLIGLLLHLSPVVGFPTP